VYHDDTRVPVIDFRRQMLHLPFPVIKSTSDFKGKDKVCLDYLTLGNGPPVFLNHMSLKKVDLSCIIRGSVSLFKRRVQAYMPFIPRVRMYMYHGRFCLLAINFSDPQRTHLRVCGSTRPLSLVVFKSLRMYQS
jgi:hypothetical protein